MSYQDFYMQASKVADMIRNGTYQGHRASAQSRRESAGIVRRPTKKEKKDTTELPGGGGGGFLGGFSEAFSKMMNTDDTGTIEADKPTGSVDVEGDNYPTFLGETMAMFGPQINTRQNRADNGEQTPDDIEAERQERMRQDFSQHVEGGGTVKNFDFVKYQFGDNTIRNKPVSSALLEDMSFLQDMGIQMVVYSGGQDAKGHGNRRTGSTRHDDGNAADAYFVDMRTGKVLDWSKPENKRIFQEIFYRGYQNGVQGWGAHAEYMGTKSVHLGYGNPAVWGKGGTGRPADWLWEAWNNARAGRIPQQFAQDAEQTRGLMERPTASVEPTSTGTGSLAPASLVHEESRGHWDATNDAEGSGGKGHFGRVQFSRGRYSEAQAAGAVPKDMPIEEFAKPENKDIQIAAENWHFKDIENFIKRNKLDRYIGKTINGVRVTMGGMIAAAHLGGQTGLKEHLASNGRYNPSDGHRTLTDYMRIHMS